MKPKVFIGSSKEALHVAEVIQQELAFDAEPVLWSQGVFRHINVPIEDLMSAVERFDFAVFVLRPEDLTKVRDNPAMVVRDNVIFELGLFLGKLGRQRNYFIAPTDASEIRPHLPSDLSGISPAKYNPDAEFLRASVGTALLQLKESLRNVAAHHGRPTILYESGSQLRQVDFECRNGKFWDKKKANLAPQQSYDPLPKRRDLEAGAHEFRWTL